MAFNSPGFRLSALSALIFGTMGVFLPFFPVWLESLSFPAVKIGLILAGIQVARILASPLSGALTDRFGRLRPMISLLGAATFFGFGLLLFSSSFPGVLTISFVAGGFLAGLIPVCESLSLLSAHRLRLTYGRIRLWGSLAFIATATGTGWILETFPRDVIIWLILAGISALVFFMPFVPEYVSEKSDPSTKPPSWRTFLNYPRFLLILAGGSFLLGAHALLMALASVYRLDSGPAAPLVRFLLGLAPLWVILFVFSSASVLKRFRPGHLLLIAAAGGGIRWILLGLFSSAPVLILAQSLHAFSFGATHLAVMETIERDLPHRLTVRGQSLYAMGLIQALMMPATGFLYENFGSAGFFSGLPLTAVAVAFAVAALTQEVPAS